MLQEPVCPSDFDDPQVPLVIAALGIVETCVIGLKRKGPK
ncbi:hypothetical protein FB004_106159 [Sinorhizobium medicae]|uniref:Uncharacterized protein n=1 Tax=Sinorhizobium medicae TaxID=110321 RepID=A0A508WWN8_9HYPH|nr:hypothetical protein FB004_106159 [Sinorhizobium medicae]TWA25529.1 hypothetical protein FB006_105187 [Sinorhizobium medicae]TWA36341.1 hypothetical protein FB007_105187 [Sinorhizobium medicae]TWA38603.1 hypothetical protein FB009_107187 [Sinorhizobium medicae]TWA45063.1 hypothetical protein FB005_106158 [Sinorhizobium medicae]